MNKITTIKLSKETLDKIKELGNMGETYEDVILRILNSIPNKGNLKGGKEQ